jgi:protein-tyrosine kinase
MFETDVKQLFAKQTVIIDSLHVLEQNSRLIFLTANPGEGTTTAILASGRLLTEGNNRLILYIDASFKNPDLHRRLNVDPFPGLSDFLSDPEMDWQTCIRQIGPQVHLIPAGSDPLQIPVHIASNRFSDLMQRVHSIYDNILMDANPLSESLPPKTVLEKFDGVILVIECERTRWQVARHAKDHIEAHQSKVAGVILNKRKLYIPKWLYMSI